MEMVFQVLVVLFLALLAWHFLKPRCNFRIVVQEARIDVQGSVLSGKREQVADFFRNDLPVVHYARVRGYWDGKCLRLSFRGELPPTLQQRVRNFLLLTL